MSDPEAPAADEPAAEPGTGDRVLVVAFWGWAAVLLVATIAQLFEIEPVLDALDVKRWFAR